MTSKPRIVAPQGSPLHSALIGTENLERSLDFYQNQIGLDVLERRAASGPEFEAHWKLPAGSDASVVVLADRGASVGRITLFQFHPRPRTRIRTMSGQSFYGLVNINFYTEDIHRQAQRLRELGFRPWTEPTQHLMDPSVGSPTEVMIDGPDGIIVNLVELTSGSPDSRIGHMRAFVKSEFGYNRAGFTPVVTSQHCVADLDRARHFYEEVLGMGVLIDAVLEGDALNHFMDYPAGSKTRSVFMQGNHMFGKIALGYPMNQKFVNLTALSQPPVIGYFAQSFLVRDLEVALERAQRLEAEIFSAPLTLDVPGIGRTRAAVVMNPGSGALQELVAGTP